MKIVLKTLLLFISLVIFINCKNIPDKDKVIGFWSITLPDSNINYGYIFNTDDHFYFWDKSILTIKSKYYGSSGRWKITDGKILIQIEYNYIWKNDFIKDSYGIYVPGDNNAIDCIKHNDTKWVCIGYTALYTEEKVYQNKKEVFSKPENIFLRPIVNKEVMESFRSYWRICIFNKKEFESLCERPKEIISGFQMMKSKGAK